MSFTGTKNRNPGDWWSEIIPGLCPSEGHSDLNSFPANKSEPEFEVIKVTKVFRGFDPQHCLEDKDKNVYGHDSII